MFKLNMSDKEADSKVFEILPTGKYAVRITDMALENVSKPGDNFGKPFWKITLTVEEGQYQGRQIITTAMLFPGALYSIKQMCDAINPQFIDADTKAINLPTVENGMPDTDPWMGKTAVIKGTKLLAGTKRGKTSDVREFDEFQVSWLPPVDGKVASSGGASSMDGLPVPS